MTKLRDEIPAYYERIRKLLSTFPSYRDNPYRLHARLMWESLPEELKTIEVSNVLGLIAERRLPKAESVLRNWRRVLEKNPHLRDKGYDGRQDYQNEIKEIIRES